MRAYRALGTFFAAFLLSAGLTTPAHAAVNYPNCAAVWAAGAAPLFSFHPGFRAALDTDHDGVACEDVVNGQPPRSEVVRYSWAPSLYSVTFLATGPVWHHLTMTQWAATGHPDPREAAWIEGTLLFKYETSPEIFATLDGVLHKLTYAEWSGMEFRPPTVKRGGYLTSLYDHFDAVVFSDTFTLGGPGLSFHVSFSEWAAAEYPTPILSPLLPGDRICFGPAPDLIYRGITVSDYVLSYAEWELTNFYPPQTC